MKLQSIKEMNERIALRGTLVFGSMWTTYVFFCYGFMPLFFPQYMNNLMYWSNTVQLWSLPLLMVGQVVLGKASEKRAEEDHQTIMAEFAEIKDMHKETHEALTEIKELHQEIHEMLQKIQN